MASDYIPGPDADCLTWLGNFSVVITASPTDYGLIAGDATEMTTRTATFSGALAAATNGSTRGPMTVAAKDIARANAVVFARSLAARIQAYPEITSDQLVALGLTVRKTGRTPVPDPVTAPLLSFISASALRHTLRYSDETTPDSRKKPFGSAGLMVSWWILPSGTPASGPPTQFGIYSANPMVFNFQLADVGKVVTYSAQWMTATGAMGPISNVVTAAVIGSPNSA
jgi:hypothetical protein